MNKPQSRPGAKAPNKAKPGKQPIDPLLAQRLQQLGTRRPAGAPLPPPTPGTAAGAAKQATQNRPAASSAPAGSQEAKLAAAAARAAAARAAKQGGGNGRVTPPSSKRAKPAASSKVASVAISAATTLALAGWFARQDTGTTESVVLTSGTDPVNATNGTTATTTTDVTVLTTPTTAAGATEQTTATTQAPATTAAAASGGIADGTYVGDGSRNRFGTVQVQVVYSGGQLTDVQILSYPDGDRRSIRINQVALPILIDEAIQSQSANINGVSGATYTSRSYVASLQSAIDNAKQASGIS